jgi:hypothetical protein
MPKGGIFSSESIAVIPKSKEDTWPLLGFLCSTLSQELVYVFGEYRKIENRAVSNFPITSSLLRSGAEQLKEMAKTAVGFMSQLESMDEISGLFIRPDALVDNSARECRSRRSLSHRLSEVCQSLDNVCERLVFRDDSAPVLRAKSRSALVPIYAYRCVGNAKGCPGETLISYVLGAALGRWDVRIALDPALAPKLPDPFDPLPVCPPGMLVGPDGLPAGPGRIVSEEWLRTRPDANTLPPDGLVKNPTIPDSEYPLRISWDGVLVDDPGFNGDRPHRDDIVRRVREVLDLLWKEKAHEIEQEACDILGVSELRDYFRKPAKFFQDHLKRYSKSRRKAPIYWPLSTASGSYTLWIYYHRLTDQTLYTAVNKYVEPKISEVERSLRHVEDDLKAASGGEATRLRDRLNETQTFLGELRDLREELLRIAALPYKPDLNDGVIISAAPLNGLFSLRSWANDTKKVWNKLKKGDYDWAHLAYAIWPDRVRNVCKKDRSIAIAHGLEELCEVENPASKKKGGRGRRRKENSL